MRRIALLGIAIALLSGAADAKPRAKKKKDSKVSSSGKVGKLQITEGAFKINDDQLGKEVAQVWVSQEARVGHRNGYRNSMVMHFVCRG